MSDTEPKPDTQTTPPLTAEEEVAALAAEGFYVYMPTSFPDLEVDAPELSDTREDRVISGAFRIGRLTRRARHLVDAEIEELGFGEGMVRIGPYVPLEVLEEYADQSRPAPTLAFYVHESVHPDNQLLRDLF